jgi:hypothetical protein
MNEVLKFIIQYREEIRTIAATATFFGVIVAVVTIWINTRRARKELAVKLVNDWAGDYSLQMKQAFDLADNLKDGTIAAISQGKAEVHISDTSLAPLIERILKDKDVLHTSLKSEKTEDFIKLSADQCKIIYHQWTSTLNRIEAIFIALDSGTANPRIMNRVFEPLIVSRGKLLNRLTSPPNDYFPAIRRILRKYPNYTEFADKEYSPTVETDRSAHHAIP